MPGLPLLDLTRCNAAFRLARSRTSSINWSVLAGRSGARVAVGGSVPSLLALELHSWALPEGQDSLGFLPPAAHEMRTPTDRSLYPLAGPHGPSVL